MSFYQETLTGNYFYTGTYEIVAADAEGDAIEFSGSLPNGFTLTDHGDGTATLSGMPSNDKIGSELWTSITATSGPTRKSDIQYFNIAVEPNTTIVSRPNGKSIAGQPYSYSLSATQHEPFGELRYTLDSAPAWLAFNAELGILTGTPSEMDAGVAQIVLSCTDDSDWSVTQTYSLTVLSAAFPYGFWSSGGGVEDVVLQGNYTYAVTLDGLYVIDLSDPISPTEIAFLAGAGGSNVALDQSRVAVSYDNVFGIIDVSNPTDPVLIQTHSLGNEEIIQLRYDNNKIYTIGDHSLYIVDVQDPKNPVLLYAGEYGDRHYQYLKGLDIEGVLLGIYESGEFGSGLMLFDVSDPANPIPVNQREPYEAALARIDTSSNTMHVDDLVYVASTAGGLEVIQSDVVVYSYPDVDFEINAVAADSRVVVLAAEDGLYVSAALNHGPSLDDLPSEVETYSVLSEEYPSITIQPSSYVQVFGKQGNNEVNVKKFGRVYCTNFIGENEVNIQGNSFDFTCYRSGATVYMQSTLGTIIRIPATLTPQVVRFSDGSSDLVISSGQIYLGYQVIGTIESAVQSPVDASDTSEIYFVE